MKRVLTATLTAGLSLAGCGEDSKRAEPFRPACAKAGPPVPLPSGFPDPFPLPDGTRITRAVQSAAKTLVVVDGFVPLGFKPTVSFLRRELPRAGYTVDDADIEKDEVETLYSGRGVDRGSWIVFEIPGCPQAVKLTVTAAKD
jgi:hypothetical protein